MWFGMVGGGERETGVWWGGSAGRWLMEFFGVFEVGFYN